MFLRTFGKYELGNCVSVINVAVILEKLLHYIYGIYYNTTVAIYLNFSRKVFDK